MNMSENDTPYNDDTQYGLTFSCQINIRLSLKYRSCPQNNKSVDDNVCVCVFYFHKHDVNKTTNNMV